MDKFKPEYFNMHKEATNIAVIYSNKSSIVGDPISHLWSRNYQIFEFVYDWIMDATNKNVKEMMSQNYKCRRFVYQKISKFRRVTGSDSIPVDIKLTMSLVKLPNNVHKPTAREILDES